MVKENNKIDFDLSTLSLEELIQVYDKIEDFLVFLEEARVEIEDKGANNE